MRNVIVPQIKSSSLVGQLKSLYETLKDAKPNEDLNFDLNQLSFACPLLILPLCSYLNTTKSEFVISKDSKIKSYLDVINFPKGITSVSSFHQKIQKDKNYIPISVLTSVAQI